MINLREYSQNIVFKVFYIDSPPSPSMSYIIHLHYSQVHLFLFLFHFRFSAPSLLILFIWICKTSTYCKSQKYIKRFTQSHVTIPPMAQSNLFYSPFFPPGFYVHPCGPLWTSATCTFFSQFILYPPCVPICTHECTVYYFPLFIALNLFAFFFFM